MDIKYFDLNIKKGWKDRILFIAVMEELNSYKFLDSDENCGQRTENIIKMVKQRESKRTQKSGGAK